MWIPFIYVFVCIVCVCWCYSYRNYHLLSFSYHSLLSALSGRKSRMSLQDTVRPSPLPLSHLHTHDINICYKICLNFVSLSLVKSRASAPRTNYFSFLLQLFTSSCLSCLSFSNIHAWSCLLCFFLKASTSS
jgi:hypothetical protein